MRNLSFSVLALAFAAMIYSPMYGGCGGSTPNTRMTALTTLYSTVNATSTAFTAWDRAHQEDIVKNATSAPDGQAKLAAYRVKREPVMTAFTVAYSSIAAALTVSDQPSADSAAKAVGDLMVAIEAIKKELGGS